MKIMDWIVNLSERISWIDPLVAHVGISADYELE